MARARNIKPAFFKNEVLGVADPLYSLLFEGLWVLADRAGRLEDRPLRIKGEIFPYRDGLNVSDMLDWLQSSGFIQRYTANGKKCILVLEFVKHQNPHKNEAESELPAPDIGNAISEEIGTKPEFIGSTRADSLSSDSLSSDSLSSDSLIPDNGSTEPEAPAAPPPPPKPKIAKPEGVEDQTWADWLQLRKTKRAPVTQTVINGAISEANKAGIRLEDFLQVWCRRGSQGLEASWLKESEKPTRQQPVSFKQADAEAGWARWEEMTGRQHPDRVQQTGRVIDITPKFQEIAR